VLAPGGGGGEGGGTGTGGGGDVTTNPFTKGFAFVRRDDKQLYVTDTKRLRHRYRVTEGLNVHAPSLSNDGKRIVFVHAGDTDSELDVVSAKGGAVSTC